MDTTQKKKTWLYIAPATVAANSELLLAKPIKMEVRYDHDGELREVEYKSARYPLFKENLIPYIIIADLRVPEVAA